MVGTFVAVEGPTGVGKTTLARRLGPLLNAQVVLDPFADNPFLPELLTARRCDPVAALRVELTFVALRVAQLRHIGGLLAAGRTVVADWALLKQALFAATSLAPADAARLAATVTLWSDGLPVPDVLVGLTAPPATLRARVAARARDMEAGVTEAELAALSAAFDAALARWPGRLIRLDTTAFTVFNNNHLAELAAQLRHAPATTILEVS